MRTMYAHHVSAVALAKLQLEAYASTGGLLSNQAWRGSTRKGSSMFHYWYTMFSLKLIGHVFVRAHRGKSFPIHLSCFFCSRSLSYASWMPVHICDMENLPPSIHNEFHEYGYWVVIHKTKNCFSAMPIHQAHEQNNAIVKGSGGSVGLTQNPPAFRKCLRAQSLRSI